MKYFYRSLVALFLLILAWFSAGYFAFQYLIRPTSQSVPMPSDFEKYSAKAVVLTTKDDFKIASWWVEPFNPDTTRGAVILMACLRGNRLTVASRARFYLKQGFATLLLDLRGTGESDGDFISFGWYESQDVLAAVDYLKTKKQVKKIALHGLSAGAAAICYALPELDSLHFIVLESCYDKMEHAFQNRVKQQFGLSKDFFYPVEFFAQRTFKNNFYKLNPIDYVAGIRCPVFILSGAEEYRVQKQETQALFDRVQAPKRLWLVKGLGHTNFHRHQPVEYERQLTQFLQENNLIQGVLNNESINHRSDSGRGQGTPFMAINPEKSQTRRTHRR